MEENAHIDFDSFATNFESYFYECFTNQEHFSNLIDIRAAIAEIQRNPNFNWFFTEFLAIMNVKKNESKKKSKPVIVNVKLLNLWIGSIMHPWYATQFYQGNIALANILYPTNKQVTVESNLQGRRLIANMLKFLWRQTETRTLKFVIAASFVMILQPNIKYPLLWRAASYTLPIRNTVSDEEQKEIEECMPKIDYVKHPELANPFDIVIYNPNHIVTQVGELALREIVINMTEMSKTKFKLWIGRWWGHGDKAEILTMEDVEERDMSFSKNRAAFYPMHMSLGTAFDLGTMLIYMMPAVLTDKKFFFNDENYINEKTSMDENSKIFTIGESEDE